MAQLINEAKRFQKLAGIINEGQLDPKFHNAILKAASALDILLTMSSLDSVARQALEDVRNNILPGIADFEGNLMEEDGEIDQKKKALDSIEDAINSPQAQATLQKMAAQLSDEDKQRIMKFMSSVNESAAGVGEPDLEDVAKKLMALSENNGPQDPQNRSTAQHLLGQVVYGAPVAAMGAGLIKGILAGGAAAGLAAATPLFAAAAAGAVLIGLAKIIFRKKSAPSNNVGGVNVISNPIIRKK